MKDRILGALLAAALIIFLNLSWFFNLAYELRNAEQQVAEECARCDAVNFTVALDNAIGIGSLNLFLSICGVVYLFGLHRIKLDPDGK